MDPVTLIAAFTAFTAFNNYLVTPPGQKMATDQEVIFTNLMSHFGVHLAPSAQQVAAASAITPNATAAGTMKAQ